VVQWKVTIDMLEETATLAEEPEEMFAPLQIKPTVNKNHENHRERKLDYLLSLEEKVPEIPESKDRDAYMAEQHPWWKVAVAPSDPTSDPLLKDAPQSALKLGWVFGNSASWLRQSIQYLHGNEICYPAGEVLVGYSKGEHKQRHGLGHTYEIASMAISPDSITVATAQAGTRPSIILWDTKSMKIKKVLNGLHRDVVRHLRFSQPDGKRLLSVGQDYSHTIGIWDVATGQLIAQTRGGEAKVFDIQWAPNGGGGSFVQVGYQHIKFHVIRGRNIDTEMGVFGDEKDVPFTTMMCVGYVKGDCAVAGGTDGSLFKFEGRNLDVVAAEAHVGGPINVIFTAPDRLLTGGFDGKVRMWSSPDLDLVGDFDLNTLNPCSMIISSLCLSENGETILVANEGCEVFEISSTDGSNSHGPEFGPVMTGHCEDQLRGICVNPKDKNIVVTVGDDCTVRKWNVNTRKMLGM
jgi:WD40 repeat protein